MRHSCHLKSVLEYTREVTRQPSGTGLNEVESWSVDTQKVWKNGHYGKPGLPKIDTSTFDGVPQEWVLEL